MEHLQITFRGIEPSDALERRIREKAADLELFSDQITRCHVTVESAHKRHHKGNLFAVRLLMHVPGREIVVGREHGHDHAHEDAYVAVMDAFDAAVRQLVKVNRSRRVFVQQSPQPPHRA